MSWSRSLREPWRVPGPHLGRWQEGLVHRREWSWDSAEIVGACEAFLLGRLLEHVEEHAAPMPVWVWTNLLAHGTEDELRLERAAVRERTTTSRGDWREARSYLASEVLDLAATYGPLAEVQRAALVPLELELAARADVVDWSARQWVGAVQASLSGYRHARRRAAIRAGRPSR